MPGTIILEGGAEFGGKMAEPDQRAIELAGGPDARIVILPTAAAPDHNHARAGTHGVRWFLSLGARQVTVLPVIDRLSANSPEHAAVLQDARLIYLLGGFTHFLGQTLAGSLCWQAALDAFQRGAVIAGSSAGAMVLCEHYYNPESSQVMPGLGLVPGALVIPHHNSFGKRWAPRLSGLLPNVALLGIDEQTGLISDGPGRAWSVYGKGSVTLYRGDQKTRTNHGESLTL